MIFNQWISFQKKLIKKMNIFKIMENSMIKAKILKNQSNLQKMKEMINIMKKRKKLKFNKKKILLKEKTSKMKFLIIKEILKMNKTRKFLKSTKKLTVKLIILKIN